MSEETWPERYAKLDQSFDRREWRKQYEQQWAIECDHARQTGKVGLAIDIYRKETRCADCGKLLHWRPGTRRRQERSSGGGEARDLGEGLRHVQGLQTN